MSTPSSSFRINLDAAHRSPKRLHHALPHKPIASRTAKMRSSLLFASTLTFTRVNGILSTFTSASTATIVCTETPLPEDCIQNSWTGTVYITIPPGFVVDVPGFAGDPVPTSWHAQTLTQSINLTGPVTGLPSGTRSNFLTGLPTITRAPEAKNETTGSAPSTSAGSPTGDSAPTNTPGAAAGREVHGLGAVVGALLLGVAML